MNILKCWLRDRPYGAAVIWTIVTTYLGAALLLHAGAAVWAILILALCWGAASGQVFQLISEELKAKT